MKRIQLRYILLAVTALGLLVWGAAVTIPNSFTSGDVISASEMNANFTAVKGAVDTNESDIATLQADQVGGAQSLDSNVISLTGGVQAALQVDVTAPSAGFVLVIATSEAEVSHTTGTSSNLVYFGVSDSATTIPDDQDKDLLIPSGAPTGSYYLHVAAQKIFPVTAGAHTFYALANAGSGTWGLDGTVLSAVYFPASVGTVSTAGVAPAGVSDGE